MINPRCGLAHDLAGKIQIEAETSWRARRVGEPKEINSEDDTGRRSLVEEREDLRTIVSKVLADLRGAARSVFPLVDNRLASLNLLTLTTVRSGNVSTGF